MFSPLINLLIQFAGLYGAFRIGTKSVTYDAKTRKLNAEPFKGGIKGMFDRDMIGVILVGALLVVTLINTLGNLSGGGYSGGGYGGGGYGGGGYGGGMMY